MREELRVRVLTDAGEKFFGEGPYRLLRGVERLGSLRAAAGELGMAYSKANRIMGRAERLLGAPLTRRRIGGPDGGGSALTPLARELLARYETFRADCEAAAKASFARNFGDLSVAAETANGLPPTSPNHPSGDSSLAAEAREQRFGESEGMVAAQGAAAGDHFAQSSGDFPEEGRAAGDTCHAPEANSDCLSGDSSLAAEAREQRFGESEGMVAAQGATAAGDHSAQSSGDFPEEGRAAGDTCHAPEANSDCLSGDSPFAAEAKERRTGEPECAVAGKEATAAGDHSAQSSGDFPEVGRAAGDTRHAPEANSDCLSGDSPFAAEAKERRTGEPECAAAGREVTAAGDHSAQSSGDFPEEGRAAGDTRHAPEANSDCLSGDSSLAAEAREQRFGKSEGMVAAQGATAAGDHSARSSGDFPEVGRAAGDTSHVPEANSDCLSGDSPFAAEAKERRTGEHECAVAGKEATAAGDHSAQSSGDSSLAAEAQAQRTGEPENVAAARGATAGKCFARSFGDILAPAARAADAADCLPQKKPNRHSGDSSLAADEQIQNSHESTRMTAMREAAARSPTHHPDEASQTVPGCPQTASGHCERHAEKSALAALEMAAGEPSRFPGEVSSAAPSCSRFTSEDCEQHASKSIFAAREAVARESFRFPNEASSAAPDCSHSASEDCERHAGKSVLAARGMVAQGSSSFPNEASSATPNCSRSAAKDCERLAGEPALAAAMQPAASESCRHSGESPAGLGCVVLAAGRARRFGGGKLLAELGGRPVLARTLEALPRGNFCRIAVVTSDLAVSALCRKMGFPVREYPGGALSDSIREGLAEMDGTGGCMFVNGDQPLLRADSLRRLASAFAEDPARVYRLAHGGTAASPAVFPASAYPALRALTGESGGMAALKSGEWEVRCVEAVEEDELWDVDDEDALRRAEEWLRENSRR